MLSVTLWVGRDSNINFPDIFWTFSKMYLQAASLHAGVILLDSLHKLEPPGLITSELNQRVISKEISN